MPSSRTPRSSLEGSVQHLLAFPSTSRAAPLLALLRRRRYKRIRSSSSSDVRYIKHSEQGTPVRARGICWSTENTYPACLSSLERPHDTREMDPNAEQPPQKVEIGEVETEIDFGLKVSLSLAKVQELMPARRTRSSPHHCNLHCRAVSSRPPSDVLPLFPCRVSLDFYRTKKI